MEADYPDVSSRGLALAGLLFFLKLLLLIPHLIILWFLSMVQLIAVFIGYIVVLITGRYPRGLFDFVVGVTRWQTRTNLWLAGVVDRYPPD